MYSSISSSLTATVSPLDDAGLQAPHPVDPAVVVAGLALEEREDLGVREYEEALLADGH